MKKQVCVLAFDDSPHEKSDLIRYIDTNSPSPLKLISLIGVTCRGLQLLHVEKTSIHVDGLDSTEKILTVFNNNPFRKEIRLIMIDSPTLGGFNPPDPFEIYEQTQVPVVLLPDKTPKSKIWEIYSKVFPNRLKQIEFLKKLPPLESLIVKVNRNPSISRKIYFHVIGVTKGEIVEILQFLSEYSAIPEPLRIAHIIASSQILYNQSNNLLNFNNKREKKKLKFKNSIIKESL